MKGNRWPESRTEHLHQPHVDALWRLLPQQLTHLCQRRTSYTRQANALTAR
jgi:hypothetical protein